MRDCCKNSRVAKGSRVANGSGKRAKRIEE